MVGSVFVKIMEDVESEGWKEVRLQWQDVWGGAVWNGQRSNNLLVHFWGHPRNGNKKPF